MGLNVWHGLALGGVTFLAGIVLPRVQVAFERSREVEPSAPPILPDHPTIDVIIPAYLESGVIGNTIGRLRTSLSQHEGATQIIVVASDAATAEAARRAGAAQVLETERQGKASAINAGVAASNADIVVLSDGNCEIREIGRASCRERVF